MGLLWEQKNYAVHLDDKYCMVIKIDSRAKIGGSVSQDFLVDVCLVFILTTYVI